MGQTLSEPVVEKVSSCSYMHMSSLGTGKLSCPSLFTTSPLRDWSFEPRRVAAFIQCCCNSPRRATRRIMMAHTCVACPESCARFGDLSAAALHIARSSISRGQNGVKAAAQLVTPSDRPRIMGSLLTRSVAHVFRLLRMAPTTDFSMACLPCKAGASAWRTRTSLS